MSATTVSNVTFTKDLAYNGSNAVVVDVDTNQPIGRVIYVPTSGPAKICSQTTTTSGLEYNIGTDTLKINNPATSLNKDSYYVVIGDDPCNASVTKKFFKCIPPPVYPKPASKASAAPAVTLLSAAPAAPVSALAITNVVRFDSGTINGMFNENSTVYVCPTVNKKVDCVGGGCLFKTDISLNTIFKKHYEKQVKIVDSLQTNSNHGAINTLHEFINGLYNYVNTATNPNFTSFNEEYAMIVTKVSITDHLDKLKSNFRTLILNTATNKRHEIEKDSKDKYDNLIVTSDTINSKLPNINDNIVKLKYILMESINNFFYILLFKLVEPSSVTVEYTAQNITNVSVNNIPILLSKLNNVNARIYIKYNLSTDSISTTPKIFYKGIDNSILAEVDITDTKTLIPSIGDIIITVNGQNYDFTKINVKGISTITGGSRKTKKRNAKLNKQSRKTKKQSRK